MLCAINARMQFSSIGEWRTQQISAKKSTQYRHENLLAQLPYITSHLSWIFTMQH
jgi:hypothetical protein